LERKVIITADGSSTIYLPEWDENYHSKHGAIQEAYHVFIIHGLNQLFEQGYKHIAILEIGFGTGLNALITSIEAEKQNRSIDYYGVEAYPVMAEDVAKLNYIAELKAEDSKWLFETMHQLPWEETHQLSPSFTLTKQKKFFADIQDKEAFDIIYFDAFGARVQPELWTEAIFQNMYDALIPNGILVTYSAKGSVRRAMQAVGFSVEKLPGPPGKREMLRAWKKA
jgi:tRNA U34 5-methylaminomethyl-2-thiouridine-forming methyltransferase MnmC